jgi:glycosyltransferase involved in cell wall biosynthesis
VYATDVRPEKGIDTLLEVFRGLDGGSVELDVFGELAEPYRDDSADAVAGWPKGVRYRGAVDSDSLRAALGAYDCLLLPTRCNSEGYPGIIIEAFGAGVPVVASRIGAIPEIVDDSCGILLDPLDIDAWGDAISWISSSATIRRGLKQGALVRGASFDSRIWNGQVLVKVLALAAGKGTQE